jgi:hypothetical protein
MKPQLEISLVWQAAALRARLARTKARIKELRASRHRALLPRTPRAPRRAR